MTDKQLIKQLKRLKELKPNKDWQSSCRSVLKTQVENSGGHQTSAWQNFYINLKCIGNIAYRPAVGVASFLIVVIGLSFFAHQWFQSSKPNDSLYIARVISERARLSTVLDSAAREKMAAKFAMNHAQDISNILADADLDYSVDSEELDKLNEDFNREIAIARDRVSSWQTSQEDSVEDSSSISPSDEEESENLVDDDDSLIVVADNHRDDSGVQVSSSTDTDDEKEKEEKEELETTATSTDEVKEDEISENELMILEEQIIETEEEIKDEKKDSSPVQLLDEAKKLFDQGSYKEASEKLSTIQEMIK